MIDVHAYVGGYPWRHVPHPDPEVLVRVLAREGLDGAWVGHLPGAFHRDPAHANAELFERLAPHASLRPVPIVRPDWPGWERTLRDVAERSVPAVRAYPQLWGMGPDDPSMRRLSAACSAANLALLLTVRFEDVRQRHPLDVAGDVAAAAVRQLARGHGGARLVVLGAGREYVEEVHWGLTPEERQRVFWDFSWIWGPPEDEFAHLLRTVGADRFVYGTGWPLRLTQNPRANLALLPEDVRGATLADPASW